jgi:hypothetical protein
VVLDFDHFGKNTIKTWKMGPDGVAQVRAELASLATRTPC